MTEATIAIEQMDTAALAADADAVEAGLRAGGLEAAGFAEFAGRGYETVSIVDGGTDEGQRQILDSLAATYRRLGQVGLPDIRVVPVSAAEAKKRGLTPSPTLKAVVAYPYPGIAAAANAPAYPRNEDGPSYIAYPHALQALGLRVEPIACPMVAIAAPSEGPLPYWMR